MILSLIFGLLGFIGTLNIVTLVMGVIVPIITIVYLSKPKVKGFFTA